MKWEKSDESYVLKVKYQGTSCKEHDVYVIIRSSSGNWHGRMFLSVLTPEQYESKIQYQYGFQKFAVGCKSLEEIQTKVKNKIRERISEKQEFLRSDLQKLQEIHSDVDKIPDIDTDVVDPIIKNLGYSENFVKFLSCHKIDIMDKMIRDLMDLKKITPTRKFYLVFEAMNYQDDDEVCEGKFVSKPEHVEKAIKVAVKDYGNPYYVYAFDIEKDKQIDYKVKNEVEISF